jgi:predicted dehydrogenase
MQAGEDISRRAFMTSSVVAGATMSSGLFSATNATAAPSDRITIGMIGVGARAHQILETVKKVPGTQIVAICDAYKGRIERALERIGTKAKVAPDYREILADKSIDTVIIVTPDHWHKTMAIDAVRAGKDVYIEKPLTYAIDEGNEIIAAVKAAGRILQVGSQGISGRLQQKAKEIVQSGKLGQVTLVRANFNRNTDSGAWVYPIPPDASPQTVNWEQFLGSAPRRPYDAARFFRWRCYQDYSGGLSTDLFVHLMTSIHFMMNAKAPSATVASSGLYRRKESRDTPDTLNASLEYPEGFMVSLSGTFNNQANGMEEHIQILGTEGSLELGEQLVFYPELNNESNQWITDSWPRPLQEAYYQDPKIQQAENSSSRPAKVLAGRESWREEGLDSDYLHLAGFFDCVRQKRQPVEDALAGHRAAAVAHLVNLAAKQKRMLEWDFSREMVKG